MGFAIVRWSYPMNARIWSRKSSSERKLPRLNTKCHDRTVRLSNEQYNGCGEYERCQGRGDQPTQPSLAGLGTQMQNLLSSQDVGRQRAKEVGAPCRSVTQDSHQYP